MALTVLVLGGTTEGSAVARALAGDARFRPVLSLAGRTRAPVLPAVQGRRGGFGGVAGLVAYLRAERVGAVVDATHPFAARMWRNAAAAAAEAGVPLVKLVRPAWQPVGGDRWTMADDMGMAAAALGPVRRRVFLTVGQQELAPFIAAPWHAYLVRSVEVPAVLPAGARFIEARGPFRVEDEERLLRQEGVQVLVTKNSGGTAVSAKLEAARRLGIEAVMVRRPFVGAGVPDVSGAMAWLELVRAAPTPGPPLERSGVI